MRVVLFTILIALVELPLLAQTNGGLEKQTLASFINQVSKEYDVTFSYSKDFVSLKRPVTVAKNKADLATVLDETFANEPISYKWIGKTIVLKSKPATAKKVVVPQRTIASHLTKPAPAKRGKPVYLASMTSFSGFHLTSLKAPEVTLEFKKTPKVKPVIAKPVFDKRTNSITAFNPLDFRMPRMIVLQAFERIEDNFYTKPQTFEGSFQEVFMEDGTPVSLVEAIVNISDRGYKQVKNDQKGLEGINLIAVRSSDNLVRPEFKADFEKFNSLRALLNWNDIKYRDKDEEYNIGRTTYDLDSSIFVNSGLIYVLSTYKRSEKMTRKITYHIDAETSAILKVIYREKSKPGHYLDQQWKLTGNQDYVFLAKETLLTYSFGKYMNKMYLKSIEEMSFADVYNSWDDNVAWEFGCQRQLLIKPAAHMNGKILDQMNEQKSLALQTTSHNEQDWKVFNKIEAFDLDNIDLSKLQSSSSLNQQFSKNASRGK